MTSPDPKLTRRSVLKGGAVLAVSASAGRAALAAASASPLPFDEYRRHDALGLAALVREGEARPAELLEAAIARAEAVDPKLNAITIKHFELAREMLGRGLPAGPLRGVPFLLKDLGAYIRGTITSEGSRFFRDAVADHTNRLVERYLAAGLVVFGKTASPEFGASPSTESTLWGDTRNPWNPAHSAGGSSGGAAVAVATGIVPTAHASDGGGSIRIPASACGIFGLKPSRGRNPQGPEVYEAWAGLSVGHVVSRSVRDSAALLDATQGGEPGDPYPPLPRPRAFLEEIAAPPGMLRIGLQRRSMIPTVEVHADCVRAADEAAKLCEALGHRVEPIDPPALPLEEYFAAVGVITGTGSVLKVRNRERMLGRAVTESDLEPRNWRTYQESLAYTAEQYERARHTIHRVGRLVAQHHAKLDVVLSPTMAAPPPRLGVLSLAGPDETFLPAATAASAFTMLYNATGQPAMSVPLHWNAAGLPIGAMFVGPLGAEALLLRLAAQLEEAQPWGERRPDT